MHLLGQLDKVVKVMLRDAERQSELRSLETPTSTEMVSSLVLPQSQHPVAGDNVASIVGKLKDLEPYTKLLINPDLPDTAYLRYKLLKSIKTSGLGMDSKVCLQTHSMAGQTEDMHFMWTITDPHDTNQQRLVEQSCTAEVPQYHSRAIKRKFTEVANSLGITSAKARKLYRLATDDESAGRTTEEKDMDNRLNEFIQLGDETIIYDLRALNSRKEIYSEFFNMAETVINNEVDTAVDDRRHDTVVHLAKAMSTSDLYK